MPCRGPRESRLSRRAVATRSSDVPTEEWCAIMKRIIYDFGANNGDDIPYYLRKADVVVAVEADPALCKVIEARFQTELHAGQLYIENCVLTADVEADVVFYVNKSDHVLNQFPTPSDRDIDHFEQIILPSLSPITIIKKYGEPFYIKIDVEHYDKAILRMLFLNRIYPQFISAESHCVENFALLVSCGRYNAFKLVDGPSVSKIYNNLSFVSNDGKRETYSFPYHSAGPFGDDIYGEWLSANDLLLLLAFEGLGWKDIHATRVIETKIGTTPRELVYIKKYLYIRKYLLNGIRCKIRRLLSFVRTSSLS